MAAPARHSARPFTSNIKQMSPQKFPNEPRAWRIVLKVSLDEIAVVVDGHHVRMYMRLCQTQ